VIPAVRRRLSAREYPREVAFIDDMTKTRKVIPRLLRARGQASRYTGRTMLPLLQGLASPATTPGA